MKNTIKETTRLLIQGTLTKDEADKILLDLLVVSKRSEQLSCDTCVFNTHSWSENYPCATCCGFDKHQAT